MATETEYISRDDESEANRYMDTGGVGEPVFLDDDDVRKYSMDDFGLNLSNNPVREDFK